MKMFNKLLAATVLFAGISQSAHALLVSDSGLVGGEVGGNPVYLPRYNVTIQGAGDIGESFILNYDFTLTDSGGNSETISASATYSILDYTNTTLDLGISITNNSDPSVSILSFGFNADPDPMYGELINPGTVFDSVATDTNFPGGFNPIDVCIFAQNCAGGGRNNGLLAGNTDELVIRLHGEFDPMTDFLLSDFVMKFQGELASYELPGCIGNDCTTTSVPEPGAVALFGIGLLGLAAARRRRA